MRRTGMSTCAFLNDLRAMRKRRGEIRKQVGDGLVVARDTKETPVTSIHRRLDDFRSQIPHNRSLMIVCQWETAHLEHGEHQRQKGDERWLFEIDAGEKDVQASGCGIGSS